MEAEQYSGLANGWAWVGYIDQSDSSVWATGPFFDIISYSGSNNRPYPVREGDVIRPRKNMPQVIVGFASVGQQNVLEPPPKLTTVIDPARDYTGNIYEPTKTYLVNDVQVWKLPGKDAVVWLRLTPGEPDINLGEKNTKRVVTSVLYQVCVGEVERHCPPHNVFIGCNSNVDAWAAEQCKSLAGQVEKVSRISTESGNRCGYSIFNINCSVTK